MTMRTAEPGRGRTIARLVAALVCLAFLGPGAAPIAAADPTRTDTPDQPVSVDLRPFMDAPSNGTYLEGTNRGARAVLWFERQDQWTFRMYNSAPEHPDARSHWDTLSWWDDGFLRYVGTADAVNGTTTYDPPIIFLPRTWDGGRWLRAGTSTVTHVFPDGTTKTGRIEWITRIVGADRIRPHWRWISVTYWQNGDITRWVEDYWLGKIGRQPAIQHSAGGNLAVPAAQWDVWMRRWAPLP